MSSTSATTGIEYSSPVPLHEQVANTVFRALRRHDLIADSRPAAWSTAFGDCSRPLVTSDGKSVVCVTEGPGAFAEYSTATGNLIRTLYRARRGNDGEVLWVSSSGTALIGYLNTSGPLPGPAGSVGVITQSGFRPLSFPLASGVPLPDGVAW